MKGQRTSRKTTHALAIPLASAILIVLAACFPQRPDILNRFSTNEHGDVVYGVAYATNNLSISADVDSVILAIPTGQQMPNDVVRDIDLIWSRQVDQFGIAVVCPASSNGIPFFSKDRGWFGHGAEVIIPELLDEMKSKMGWNNQDLVLVDIGGNGRGATSVALTSASSFARLYIAPSFDVNRVSLSEYLALEGVPPITVVYGTETPRGFDDWVSTVNRGGHRIRLLRAPLSPLHRQGQIEGINLFAEYAAFICGDL